MQIHNLITRFEHLPHAQPMWPLCARTDKGEREKFGNASFNRGRLTDGNERGRRVSHAHAHKGMSQLNPHTPADTPTGASTTQWPDDLYRTTEPPFTTYSANPLFLPVCVHREAVACVRAQSPGVMKLSHLNHAWPPCFCMGSREIMNHRAVYTFCESYSVRRNRLTAYDCE